jgi:chromosome segregation protein
MALFSTVAPRSISAVSGDGSLGSAANAVKAPRELRMVLDHLLGDCLIMEDLDAARRHLKRAGYQFRAVTLAGEVIERGGAMRGGVRRGEDTAQVFSRKRELEQVGRELETLRHALANVWRFEERFEQEADGLSAQVEEATAAVSDARSALSEAERDLLHIGEQSAAAQSAADEMDGEIADLRKRLEGSGQRQEELVKASEAKQAEAKALGAQIEELRSQQLSGKELEDKRAALMENEVALAELREKQRSLQELGKRTEAERARAQTQAENAR